MDIQGIELLVQIHELAAQVLHRLEVDRGIVDKGAGLARRGQFAAQDELVLVVNIVFLEKIF